MQSSHESDTGEQGPSPGAQPPGRDETQAAHPGNGQGLGGGESAAELNEELARIEDRYKRALADLDNYRKRATREVDRRVAEARETALTDWLQVVDSVERA